MEGLRRDLHAHPELAFEERRTAAQVGAFLEGRGLSLRSGVGGTGVVASVGGPGRHVLLRVDMDGLPIVEETGAAYASQKPGLMHACGHDGHVAMGAAAARVLAGRAHAGRVDVLFQPAEEGAGGAEAVVKDGVLDGVETAIGVHLWNELPVGTIGVKAGPLMAAVDGVRILVRGRGGHGALPHRAADPVVAAAQVVLALQTVASREVSPLEPVVLTIASIHGGSAFNVIPEEVTLLGTFRTFDAALRRSMPERIGRIAGQVAQGLGCRAEVEILPGPAAVINDPGVAELARRAAVEVVGEDRVVEPTRTMGGEDMSVYLDRVPGCFVFIGSANPERGLAEPHHSPRFDFDEAALPIGCEFLVRAAEAALTG